MAINLSGKNTIQFDIWSSISGTNLLKISINDTGSGWIDYTCSISVAETWETKVWDISSIADLAKDSIDKIKITVLDDNPEFYFYIDNFYSAVRRRSTVAILA